MQNKLQLFRQISIDGTRIHLIAMSISQTFLSVGYYLNGALYFRFIEGQKPIPVRSLESVGGDEDATIAIGALLFLLVTLIYVIRIRISMKRADWIVLGSILILQALSLASIERGSIWLSLLSPSGWVLGFWLANYILIWGLLLRFLFKHRSIQKQNGYFH